MSPLSSVPPAVSTAVFEDEAVGVEFQGRARREGTEFDAVALEHLEKAGATVVQGRHRRFHYPVDAEILTPNGGRYLILAHGNMGDSSRQPGLQRPDTLAKVAHRARSLTEMESLAVVVVTSHLPKANSTCAHQLSHLHDRLGPLLCDVVATTGDFAGFHRLQRLFNTQPGPAQPAPAPWWNPGHDSTLFDFIVPGGTDA